MSLLQSMNISWCLSFALLLFKLSFPFESTEPIFAVYFFMLFLTHEFVYYYYDVVSCWLILFFFAQLN